MVGLAVAFRLPGLFANHFHADEALFATWARLIAVWRDPMLQTQLVDKPPLLFYLQALFYPLQGPVTWAARLPNWIASVLLVPVVGQLAWRWSGRGETAVFAAVFIAFNPLAIQFSPSAFTDPLLTLWLLFSLLLLLGERPGWSGITFGLALLTKHQAWLFLPLLGGMGWLRGWHWRDWRRWIGSVALLLAALLAWEWARSGSLALWQTQVRNFGGTRLIGSWEIGPRLWDWTNLWQMVLGGGWIGAMVGAVGGVTAVFLWRWGHARDRILLLFLLAYMALHWLLAVPVWDRYLLPLVPLVALLLGRGVVMFAAMFPAGVGGQKLGKRPLVPVRVILPFLILVVVLLPGAWSGRHGRFPMGATPRADHGAQTVAAFLNDAPYGTVLYDHWYSWQWRYHLFDKRVYVSWFPHPAALAEELTVFGGDDNPRYLAVPDSAVARPVLRAVADAGFALQTTYRADGIVLYRVVTGD